jgi:hypothetical protein
MTNSCGLPTLPVGPCVSLVRIYRLAIVLAAGEVNPEVQQVLEENFLWRGIAIDPAAPNGVTIRLRGANNYYLSNQRAPMRLFGLGGRRSRAFEPEMFFFRGDSITAELENASGAAVNTYINLVGVDLMESPLNAIPE